MITGESEKEISPSAQYHLSKKALKFYAQRREIAYSEAPEKNTFLAFFVARIFNSMIYHRIFIAFIVGVEKIGYRESR